jgi:hypothetical protein
VQLTAPPWQTQVVQVPWGPEKDSPSSTTTLLNKHGSAREKKTKSTLHLLDSHVYIPDKHFVQNSKQMAVMESVSFIPSRAIVLGVK